MPEYRSVVSRRNFKPTEGYPDVWNYEKKPDIVPIPKEDQGAPPINVHIEKEEETATLKDVETPSTSNNSQRHNTILRSHTRTVEANIQRLEDTSTQEQETAFAGPAFTALPSDRDMQEYMPSRLAFYNRMKPVAQGDYPFETFTHQAYCVIVYANRISVRQALQEQNSRHKRCLFNTRHCRRKRS